MLKERRPLGGIFICYRREDTAAYAQLLHYRLKEQVDGPPVFMDYYAIQPGDDFEEAIMRAVGNCELMILLIGPRWTLTDADGRQRLADPEDLVRLEVETALRRGTRVIPVLVERASMPAAEDLPPAIAGLTRRQAIELGQASFEHDMRRLLDAVERALGPSPGQTSSSSAGEPLAATRRREGARSMPDDLSVTAIEPVNGWSYRWPDNSIEDYHESMRYQVTDDTGHLDVLVAHTARPAFDRIDRGRTVVFGKLGGSTSSYQPWTEFVETDGGEYAARLYNPMDPRKNLRDGEALPPRFSAANVRRNDEAFRSIRNGPALRFVVDGKDEQAMIRYAHWSAKLRHLI